MLPLIYPVYSLFGISLITVTILVSLQNVFSILVSPAVGAAADSSGDYPRLMGIGLGIFALGAMGYALTVLVSAGLALAIILVPFTILIGVGSSFYHPIGATILRAKWRPERLGYAMGANGSIGSIGRVVLPFTATFLLSFLSLPYLGVIGAVSLAGAMGVIFSMKGMKFAREKGSDERKTGIRLFPDWSLARRLLPLTVVSFARGVFTGVMPLVPIYLQVVDGFDRVQAGLLFSASLGIGIVSQLIFGFLQTRLGARKALTISNVGGVASLLLFIFSADHTIIAATLVAFGLFSYSAFPLLLGVVKERTQFAEMTSGGAIVWGIGNSGGSAIAPLIVGTLALLYSGSPVAGFLLSALVGFLSIIIMVFV